MLLVAYDIPHDRRRDRVAGVLLRYGRRVQYSVFLLERGTAEEVSRAVEVHSDDSEYTARGETRGLA